MEVVNTINHFSHEHSLCLLTYNKNHVSISNEEETSCYGCDTPVVASELAYCCVHQCSGRIFLHKRCAEMPTKIEHPSHSKHLVSINQINFESSAWCNFCGKLFKYQMLVYSCRRCNFDIHISCAFPDILDYSEEQRTIPHPSHIHPLTLLKKPAFSFYCDGCGTEGQDKAYVCNLCEFWVHKHCASLPSTIERKDHHDHPLSLAFFLPFEHRMYHPTCDICNEHLYSVYWVYHCYHCGYLAHIRCVIEENIDEVSNHVNAEEDGDGSLVQLPVNDISKELITPFIIKQNGSIPIKIDDMPTSVEILATNSKFSILFNYHKHPLSLIKVDDKVNEATKLMTCDFCITPILSPPYYSCAECKYFLHLTCYFLPKTLCHQPTLGRQRCQNHRFTLYTAGSTHVQDHHLLHCKLCFHYTNGIVYHCQNCHVKIDAKCASLPIMIKHESHQRHKLIKMLMSQQHGGKACVGCGESVFRNPNRMIYDCSNGDCNFVLHPHCAMLPRSIKHGWDKHPLLLTYDLHICQPSHVFCEVCEEDIDPNIWMYHCRECDQSFHVSCLTESGPHRNIKFGHQFEFGNDLHPHSLTYNLVSHRLKCNGCSEFVYQRRGFECASCNYALCETCFVLAT